MPHSSATVATFFAPAERASARALARAIQTVMSSPLVGALLEKMGGVVVILNRERQVLAVNHALLDLLALDDAESLLGLRPGEVLQCVHANDMPGGCGTSRFCATCGAALAIVASQKESQRVIRECVMRATRRGKPVDLDFRVSAETILIEDQPFTLLLLEDVSAEKRRLALERTFFHDISNTISALTLTAELLSADWPGSPVNRLQHLVSHLAREVEIQKFLTRDQADDFRLTPEPTSVQFLLSELHRIITMHPASQGRHVRIANPMLDREMTTDVTLVLRVLNNMALNALEATPEGREIRIAATPQKHHVTFQVWNQKPIPPLIAGRIFQRYFSTKSGQGRGVGTFSMKLFAEKYLQGHVAFSSTPHEGTTFTLQLPAHLQT